MKCPLRHCATPVYLAALLACQLLSVRTSEACTPFPAVAPYALPRPSSTPISTATSIHIISEQRPAWVEVTAAGSLVKTDGLELLGNVYLKGNTGRAWRVLGLDAANPNGLLLPSTEYVVSGIIGGTRVELTRFSTGAGYDKRPGTPPVLRSIKLWRVHYARRTSTCVSGDYQAFIELDYQPAAVPDSPPASVLYTLWLSPKTGGPMERIYFTGADLYVGGGPLPPDNGPRHPKWPSDLDPTREYCAIMSAAGIGDLSRQPLQSDTACAPVTLVESTASPSPSGGPAPDAGLGGGSGNSAGCAVPGGDARFGLGSAAYVFLGFLWLVRGGRRVFRGSPTTSGSTAPSTTVFARKPASEDDPRLS
ncbi:MAG: hypothetical protein IT371_29720 [Deltaproteobacteria bacterium]|nr:hypothetical protein [Deltaproteobacteria bacterium]